MRFISTGLTLILALLHVWFMLLDTLFWTTPVGRAALGISQTYAEQTRVLAAHLGLFNAVLAAGLCYGVLRRSDAFKVFFLCAAVALGTLGGVTLGPVAFVIDALPALAALALLVLDRVSTVRPAAAG